MPRPKPSLYANNTHLLLLRQPSQPHGYDKPRLSLLRLPQKPRRTLRWSPDPLQARTQASNLPLRRPRLALRTSHSPSWIYLHNCHRKCVSPKLPFPDLTAITNAPARSNISKHLPHRQHTLHLRANLNFHSHSLWLHEPRLRHHPHDGHHHGLQLRARRRAFERSSYDPD
jgi:hypothetical protein